MPTAGLVWICDDGLPNKSGTERIQLLKRMRQGEVERVKKSFCRDRAGCNKK